MKKNAYKAQKINSKTSNMWSEGSGQEKKRIVGIDIAKKKMVAALRVKGEIVGTLNWNHPEETPQFLSLIEELGKQTEVVMEPSGTYGDALQEQLKRRDISVFQVSPKHTRDYAEVFDGVPSTHDGKSAAIITKLHEAGRSHLWRERDFVERDVRAQLDTMKWLQGTQQSTRGLFESRLVRHWPGLTDILSIDQYSLLALVEAYGSPEAVTQAPEEADALLTKASRGQLSKEKRKRIIELARNCLGVSMTTKEAEQIKELAEELIRLRKRIADIDKELKTSKEIPPEITVLMEVIGPRAALSIFADVGSPLEYDCPQSFRKALGLNLREHSSGTMKGRLKLTKRGAARVRQLLYLAVQRLIQSNPIINAWYHAKKTRDGGQGKKALVAIMRKLVLALWHMADKNEPFDAEKLYNKRKLTVLTELPKKHLFSSKESKITVS